MIQRKIDRTFTPKLHQGFLGVGHMAAAVIDGTDFKLTDPFILLMDDRLDLPGGEPVGGPHPHAGFETVTLVLKGDNHEWQTGSLEVMTAGKGIVHTEELQDPTSMHILQLWLVLPPHQRWATPAWQKLLPEAVPTATIGGAVIRVYSGSSNGLTSPLRHQTPFTLVDFNMPANTTIAQQLPAGYNGFVYMLTGGVTIGGKTITQGQTAWLDAVENSDATEVTFVTGATGAHFVLYAGLPQNVPIVSHGPFIGDSTNDIVRLYGEYRAGLMPHLNDLPEEQKTVYR